MRIPAHTTANVFEEMCTLHQLSLASKLQRWPKKKSRGINASPCLHFSFPHRVLHTIGVFPHVGQRRAVEHATLHLQPTCTIHRASQHGTPYRTHCPVNGHGGRHRTSPEVYGPRTRHQHGLTKNTDMV